MTQKSYVQSDPLLIRTLSIHFFITFTQCYEWLEMSLLHY
jgi:hypothetical protein